MHNYRDMVPQSTCTHKRRMTKLLISFNVHYVHLDGDKYWPGDINDL